MLGSLDEAQFFQIITQLMGCKRCSKIILFLMKSKIRKFVLVEIGTFTGYTSLTIALGLPSDGQLIACDIDDQYIRQDLWKKAGVQDKIILKIGPAIETLKKLLEENGPGSFDFVFIDADKTNYMKYYELAIELVRSNGLIAIDNTLWYGRVIDPSNTTDDTIAIRQINDFVRDDQRVDISFLRLGDGTTLCRKK
jgi:O-methyltransferase